MQESEERLRAAFSQSVTGMVITDLHGVIQRANDAFCRIVDRPREELLGRTSDHMTPPDDQKNNVTAIRELRDGLVKSAIFHKRYLRPSGEEVCTRINLSLVRNAAGTPVNLMATVEDVTAQRRVQAALEEREERLRLIFDSITDYAIITIDPAGAVIDWNPGAQEIFGYRAEEIIGQPWEVLWTSEDRAAKEPAKVQTAALASGRAHNERWHLRKDGGRFFASGMLRPIRTSNGELRGFTKICRDVTAQRQAESELAQARLQAERALEEERARLAEVFQHSPSFLAISRGPEHVFEFANERYLEISGHRDILQKTAREAFPEIQGQGFFEILDRVYQTGEPFEGKEMSVYLQRQPGQPPEECFIDLVYMPMRDATGAVTGIFTHGIDITARKLAEESLEQQARTFDVLLSSIQDYVFLFDREGRFTYANKMLLDLWGVPASRLPLSMLEDLHYDPELEQFLMSDLRAVFQTARPVMREVPYVSPTGISGHYEYILAPVLSPAGEVLSVAGTSRNISERKRVELEREQLLASERAARTEAERASQMKDDFLATLSHELRTPLNAILGWANLLGADANPADVREGVQVIERNARAQARIIDDLLDMSRIMSGKIRLDVQRTDLAAVIESALETVRPAALAKKIRLQSILDPLAQPVTGDPSRLQQVFWNLLSNAVKFTPAGGRVQVLLERVNSHLEVSVVDTGEGISAQFLPHVFDRFRQADGSTTRAHGGLGLGLAIVKQLVELHGGSVSVRSGGRDCGSTFTVSLPLGAVRPEDHGPPERRHPRSPDVVPVEAVAGIDLAGIIVLIVDDEADARSVVARSLENAGATVHAAPSAAEALALLERERPHVLISDIGMPGEDGYALIRSVRSLGAEQGGHVPAIALTAYARTEDRMKAILAGFQMHVAKPVEIAELLAMVASLAGRTGPTS